jgi:hypothetical protein
MVPSERPWLGYISKKILIFNFDLGVLSEVQCFPAVNIQSI